jgi:hypothetical protein
MGKLIAAKPADLQVPRLSALNYKLWSELITEALEGRGVWDYAQGIVEEPSDEDQKRVWRQNNAVAVGIIKGTLLESQLGHVMGIRGAKEVWDTLKKIHQRDDYARVQSLLAEFIRFRLDTTIDEGASKLSRIQSEIGMLDIASKPSDAIKTETLLAGLGPQYEATLVGLDASSSTDFEDTVSRLRKAETRLRGQGVDTPGQNLARQTFQRNKKGSNKLRPNGACFHCGKPGHFKRDCRKLLAEQESRSDSDTQGSRREVDGGHRAAVVTQNEPRTHERAWAIARQVRTVTSRTKALQTDPWYLDSAATSHMTNCRDLFTSYKQDKDTVTVADGRQLTSQGQGTIRVQFEGDWTQIHKVLYVPGLQGNLLSVGQLAERGIECLFSSTGATLRRDGETLANAMREGRNYVLYPTQGSHKAQNTTTLYGQKNQDTSSYELWHQRMGHVGEEKMRLLDQAATGVTKISTKPQGPCETCALSKSIRDVNRIAAGHTVKRLERVHTDFWGPFTTPTPSGAKYILTVTDDYTRKSWIYLTRARTELYEKFREWQTEVERQSGEVLKAVRCDNAQEYQALSTQLRLNGIICEPTTPYTPEQNGTAERLNRTLTTKIRSMLVGAELPTELWGEAAYTACYLHNRTARYYKERIVTPEEMWTGEKPDLAHLRVFGCVAYAQLAKEQRGKLDPTSMRGIFIGYTPTSRQYRIYNPEIKVVERYSSVAFNENRKGGELLDSARNRDQLRLEEVNEDTIVVQARSPDPQEDDEDVIEVQPYEPERESESPDPPQRNTRISQPGAGNSDETYNERQSRSGRQIRLPGRYQVRQVIADITTPETYEEAVSGPQKKQWETAINDELQSLAINNVWELTEAPKGANIVSCKWVFKIKRLPNGQIDRYKARLVARGFTQQYGVDYYETFAPVVRIESLRVLLAIAAREDLEVYQMDVITAYLAGELEEEIYMTPPGGLPGAAQKVCRLKKGLYGLKQSARVWNQRIRKKLNESGMIVTESDHSVWVSQDRNLILALYVDDIVLFARDMQAIQWMKGILNTNFNMKDLGPISTVLGIRVRRDRARKVLWADQSHYVKDILKEFQYENSKPLQVPADGYEYFQPVGVNDVAYEPPAKYQRALGELNWLVRGTRADLAFVVHKLSQHCHNPCVRHWKGVQQVFRYLKSSQALTLRYERDSKELLGYSDTDYASDASDRKSTMGYAFVLSGAAVTWASRKQQTVSTSTTEAEYVGLCNAAKEAVWIRNFLRDVGRSEYASGTHATRILGDNQGALRLVANPEFHARSKHIDVQHHYVRELLENNTISVDYIRTSEMAADCLTKPLKKVQLRANLEMLGLSQE